MKKVGKVARLVILGIIAAAIAIPVLLGIGKKLAQWNKQPPSVAKAPWEIETSSRIYFGEYFSLQQGVPELKNYWYLQGNKYHYVNNIISFPGDQYGEFGVSVLLVAREGVTTTK
ncbi:MAG: hypothetical protein WAU62_11200 [Dehalococcoidales bacterium]